MSEAPALILLVEDETTVRRSLRTILVDRGFRVVEAETAAEGVQRASEHNPDLVLLDLGLPDRDGIAVVTALRKWSLAPVIVLSARGQEDDKVSALDAGADDYLIKPFSANELLARIRVALRHVAQRSPSRDAVFELGEVTVDLGRRLVTRAGQEIHLTPHEYKLLEALLRHADRVVTHRQLLNEVWGPGHATETRYLRVYMVALRQKLEPVPARPRWLLTEAGVGYRLRLESPTS
ncbi:response regulator [Nannocystis punicea]|uniref:Response regulator n=1 Tax=Nannocystis punicea TaxID=2995304 RepID=A0ABY7HAP6_9BACT|nr:response regulator [Nannocystis poenicansa]WAS96360.1 response regulator [Nannocystis poenicansa]